jgi:hypothetical protein
MAVGMLLAGPAVTRENYEALTRKMFGGFPMRDDQSPEGLLIHTAGQSDQGWYIYDVWESPEHFQRFVDGQLGPATEELGVDQSQPLEPQFFPIETLAKGPAL